MIDCLSLRKKPRRWPIFHHLHLFSHWISFPPLSFLLSLNLCIILPLGSLASLFLVCVTLSLCVFLHLFPVLLYLLKHQIPFNLYTAFPFSVSLCVSVFVTLLPLTLSVTQIIQYCRCQLGMSRSPPTLANTPLAKQAWIDVHLHTRAHKVMSRRTHCFSHHQ